MDEHDDFPPNHLFISLRYEFEATRVIDQRLSPTKIKIKTDISTLDQDTDDYAVRMEVALAKLNYWMEKIANKSVIFYADNQWALDCFMGQGGPATDNTIMLCPEDPTDAVLAELILCKLIALADGAFQFHAIDIESSDGRGMGFTFVGRPGESFPEATDWLTDHNYFSKAWWNRGDASSLDVVPEDGDDLNEPPAWAYSLGFFADQMAAEVDVRENVVVRPEFRPRVIEGGKE